MKQLLCMMYKCLDFQRTHFKEYFLLSTTNFPRSSNYEHVCKTHIFDICGTDFYLHWHLFSIYLLFNSANFILIWNYKNLANKSYFLSNSYYKLLNIVPSLINYFLSYMTVFYQFLLFIRVRDWDYAENNLQIFQTS